MSPTQPASVLATTAEDQVPLNKVPSKNNPPRPVPSYSTAVIRVQWESKPEGAQECSTNYAYFSALPLIFEAYDVQAGKQSKYTAYLGASFEQAQYKLQEQATEFFKQPGARLPQEMAELDMKRWLGVTSPSEERREWLRKRLPKWLSKTLKLGETAEIPQAINLTAGLMQLTRKESAWINSIAKGASRSFSLLISFGAAAAYWYGTAMGILPMWFWIPTAISIGVMNYGQNQLSMLGRFQRVLRYLDRKWTGVEDASDKLMHPLSWPVRILVISLISFTLLALGAQFYVGIQAAMVAFKAKAIALLYLGILNLHAFLSLADHLIKKADIDTPTPKPETVACMQFAILDTLQKQQVPEQHIDPIHRAFNEYRARMAQDNDLDEEVVSLESLQKPGPL